MITPQVQPQAQPVQNALAQRALPPGAPQGTAMPAQPGFRMGMPQQAQPGMPPQGIPPQGRAMPAQPGVQQMQQPQMAQQPQQMQQPQNALAQRARGFV